MTTVLDFIKTNLNNKILIALALLIVGIVLVSNATHEDLPVKEIPLPYTNCKTVDDIECRNNPIKQLYCSCFVEFNLTQQENGTASLFYELVSFDTSSNNYKQSRDDRQLRGDLSQPPSRNCGEYAYAEMPDGEKRPIAPCGAVADSMFNDTFELVYVTNSENVPVIYTGLPGITDEDRQAYRNPPGNLEEAFMNYSKPINWRYNIWERNRWEGRENDPSHQGFQNDAFIAWMKTDMKVKPVWRVSHTGSFEHGLPEGKYWLNIQYAYPYTSYKGERIAILRIELPAIMYTNTAMLVCGILIIVSAVIIVADTCYTRIAKRSV